MIILFNQNKRRYNSLLVYLYFYMEIYIVYLDNKKSEQNACRVWSFRLYKFFIVFFLI